MEKLTFSSDYRAGFLHISAQTIGGFCVEQLANSVESTYTGSQDPVNQQSKLSKLWSLRSTVHCIKKLTFYIHSTATGTGLLQIRVQDCYGVASAILLQTKSQHDSSLHSVRWFRTFVGSRTGMDHAERNCYFEWVWLDKLGTSDMGTGISRLQVQTHTDLLLYGYGWAHGQRTLTFSCNILYGSI